ncbi:MAG: ATP-binding protein [archaeon GB-1845-036]|nr:ATP-binding protein [Candidatus Culexmicrobium thermophilum]
MRLKILKNIGTYFDDLNGKFKARLRETAIKTSTYEGGRIVLKSITAVFEAYFDISVLDRLCKPSFIAVERPSSTGIKYLIYETVSARPIHYQELSMDVSMPKILRGDFLRRIFSMWGASEDTWIDIYSVYTGYVMELEGDEAFFERNEAIMPLVGAEAYLLSSKAIDELVNVKGGVHIGNLIGFKHPLKINLVNLIKFHGGVFGFTGAGKSNLTSIIIREILSSMENTNVIIVDVAGEYSVNLLDILIDKGTVFSTENFTALSDPVEAFLASQAIPESLEEHVNSNGKFKGLFENCITNLFSRDGVKLIDLEPKVSDTIGYIMSLLKRLREDQNQLTSMLATKLSEQLSTLIGNLDSSIKLEKIEVEYPKIAETIVNLIDQTLNFMKPMRYKPEKFQFILKYIKDKLAGSMVEENVASVGQTPEDIAEYALMGRDNYCKLIVAYVPDPINARRFTYRLIDKLFSLRKRMIRGPRILVVLDEAQEFIPDIVRKDDYTLQSNIAVERLLRQGRKYRIHGWISTQRVAHLNVNAIQQIHSYFAGTLPRGYDRHVIAEAAGISPDILDKTAQLNTGEWLFISHKATKRRNIPVFIKTRNNEEILIKRLFKK